MSELGEFVNIFHTFHVYTDFVRYKKMYLSVIEQSIRAKFQLTLVCPLMLRTNYRFVQSLNISVDDAKCVENVHKH